MNICLLNASNPVSQLIGLESDIYVDYRKSSSPSYVDGKFIKQCTSWHSWPYALNTEFFVYLKDGWQGCFKYDGIIILVNREVKQVIPLIKKLKLMKKKVAIAYHEGIGDLLGGSGIPNENVLQKWVELSDVVKECDFYLNLFGQYQSMLEGWFGKNKVKYCTHTAPFDVKLNYEQWNSRKKKILIGTRTFNQRLPRNTFATICAMNKWSQETGDDVHLISEDGFDVSKFLLRMNINNINCHKGPLKFNEWLTFLSQFKYLVMHDTSCNLGQVVLDCAMTNVIPVGSTTWNSMLVGTDDGGSVEQIFLILNKVKNFSEHERNAFFKDFLENKAGVEFTKNNLMNIFSN